MKLKSLCESNVVEIEFELVEVRVNLAEAAADVIALRARSLLWIFSHWGMIELNFLLEMGKAAGSQVEAGLFEEDSALQESNLNRSSVRFHSFQNGDLDLRKALHRCDRKAL